MIAGEGGPVPVLRGDPIQGRYDALCLIQEARRRKQSVDDYAWRYLERRAEMGYTVFSGDVRVSRRPLCNDYRLQEILDAHEWEDERQALGERRLREIARQVGPAGETARKGVTDATD